MEMASILSGMRDFGSARRGFVCMEERSNKI